MPSESLVIDSTSEDAANTQVALEDSGNGIQVIRQEYPDPEPEYMGVSTADTEGTIPVQNGLRDRVITVAVRCSGASNMRARIKALQQKVGKLNREGGTLRRTLADATVITFDVKSASIQIPADWQFLHQNSVEVTLAFICDPLGREPEQQLSDHAETTLPVCIGTDTGVRGDSPARGRLVIDNDSSADWWHVVWGVECVTSAYAAAATSALFYQAESLLAQGGSSAAAVASASGGTVMRNTALSTSYQSILSGREGGTAYFTHVGDYEVWVQAMASSSNAGTVTLCLEWSLGDFRRFTRNDDDAIEIDTALEGQWIRRPLGLVHLTKPVTGAQRWEPRVLAKSTTAGDDVDVDYLFFVPVREGSGEASGADQLPQPTALSARDTFTGTTAGNNLNGRTADAGGTWATSGDATDLVFADESWSAETITRSASGVRYAVLGSTDFTNVDVAVRVRWNASGGVGDGTQAGVLARWTDASNHLRGTLLLQTDGTATAAIVGAASGGGFSFSGDPFVATAGTPYTLRLAAFSTGRVVLLVTDAKGAILSRVVAHDPKLATGGTLATGEPGIVDNPGGAGPVLARSYDDFAVAVPVADAAVFNGQSMEVRHNTALREDSGGSIWVPPSRYDGDYARPVPAGVEAKSLRTIVVPHRNDPETMTAGTVIDDLSFRWSYTPRWVSVPQP